MADPRVESLIEDLGALLEARREVVQSAYPALESALLLGFARPALLSVWQIASTLLRQACEATGATAGAWRDDDVALLARLDEVVSSPGMRATIRELSRLAAESRRPEDEAPLSLDQAYAAVEDLLGVIAWMEARKLLAAATPSKPASVGVAARASLVCRIYQSLEFELVSRRDMSEATVFLLVGKTASDTEEYVQVFVSDDLAELQGILADESVTRLAENHDIERTLIIADSPDSPFSERLSIRGDIRSLAAFLADLLGYREYVAAVRRRLRDDMASPPPISLRADVLRFDEHTQEYVVGGIEDVEGYASGGLTARAGNLLVLADSGGGKTFLCEQLLDVMLADKDNRFVLYFHLADWPQEQTLGEFVGEDLGRFSSLPIRELVSLFSLVAREGYVVCLLDAFDEGIEAGDTENVLVRFADIARLLTGRSRVVLTSRISFFQATPELRRLLSHDAAAAEKVGHALTPTGIDPLALPNFDVMRLRRVPVEVDGTAYELTPLEIQLLQAVPLASRRSLLSVAESRILGSELVREELLRNLPEHRKDRLLDELTRFFGSAYQRSRTVFRLDELAAIGDGSLFSSHEATAEGLLLRNVLRSAGDAAVRFRHLAYLEYLFARQLATVPDDVGGGTHVSAPVRRFLHEILGPSLHDSDAPEPVLPAGRPFVVGMGDQARIARIDRAIAVQPETVTVAEYRAFLEDTRGADIREFEHPRQPADWSHEPPQERLKIADYYSDPQYAAYPAVCVSWWSAYAYARSRGGRLLSAGEWEFAARGPDGRLFPWGDDVRVGKANSADFWAGRPLLTWEEWKLHFDSSEMRGGMALPASEFPANVSPFGVRGMAGNVWEWTGTTNEPVTRAGIMGASYDNPFRALRCAVRCFNETSGMSNAIGFRWGREIA